MVTTTKLYFLKSTFWFLLQFLLRGLTLAVLHVWTQNYPQNFRTCPDLPLQLLARNIFFKVIGLTPPPPFNVKSIKVTNGENKGKFSSPSVAKGGDDAFCELEGYSLGTGREHVIQPGNWRRARDAVWELEGARDAGNSS